MVYYYADGTSEHSFMYLFFIGNKNIIEKERDSKSRKQKREANYNLDVDAENTSSIAAIRRLHIPLRR